MLEFDPNNQRGPKAPRYATYIPSRWPNFKSHTNIGHARNALNVRAESMYGQPGLPGILYEFKDGEWVEIDRYDPPDQ